MSVWLKSVSAILMVEGKEPMVIEKLIVVDKTSLGGLNCDMSSDPPRAEIIACQGTQELSADVPTVFPSELKQVIS